MPTVGEEQAHPSPALQCCAAYPWRRRDGPLSDRQPLWWALPLAGRVDPVATTSTTTLAVQGRPKPDAARTCRGCRETVAIDPKRTLGPAQACLETPSSRLPSTVTDAVVSAWATARSGPPRAPLPPAQHPARRGDHSRRGECRPWPRSRAHNWLRRPA